MKALAAALLFAALPVQAATLTVHVGNVDPKGGTLRLSLYDAAVWSQDEDNPIASANVPAVAPETTVTLKDIAPGVYGIKLFQDTNNNGKFDQNFLGLPLEHYGFSRDARPFLTTPGFSRTKFTVGEGADEIAIKLQ
jgi:uncharacterized protein (DUF2141 family)